MSIDLDLTKNAREALRRIRGAAVNEAITPDEMQYHSKETLDRLAKALLSLNNKEKLKPEDRESNVSHVDELNRYVANLLPNVERLNTAGNPMHEEQAALMLSMLASENYLKRIGLPNVNVIPLLSTGAVMLAVSSYIHEYPLYVAAVSGDKTKVILPEIPKDKPSVIIDDIVGNQARLTQLHLNKQGQKTVIKNILGM